MGSTPHNRSYVRRFGWRRPRRDGPERFKVKWSVDGHVLRTEELRQFGTGDFRHLSLRLRVEPRHTLTAVQQIGVDITVIPRD